MILIKGNYYSLDELADSGLKFIKKTTITMYYRNENVLYIFEAKPNKQLQHKYLCYMED